MITPRRRKILILLLVTGLVFSIGGGATFVLNKLFHLDDYKGEILAAVQQGLKRQVAYDQGAFSLRYGPSVTFTSVVVKDRDGVATFLSAERMTVKVALLPLLNKNLVLKEVVVERPVIKLSRDAAGIFNISDMLEGEAEETPLQVKGVRIKHGSISFTDHAALAGEVTTTLEDLDLYASRLARGKRGDFKLSAKVVDKGKKGVISLAGAVMLAAKDEPFSDTFLNVRIVTKQLDGGHFWPYYSKYVPFHQVAGHLDLTAILRGKLSKFTSKGMVKIGGLRFDYPQVFHATLTPKDLYFTYDLALTDTELALKAIDLHLDGLNVKGLCRLEDLHSSDPRIVAKVTLTPFRLEEFGQYIPYGIIQKDVALFIERHVKGGTYKVDEGTLDGRISQILHMEAGDNYNILHVRGTVSKGVLSFGPAVPEFNALKGGLEMLGKDFILSRMTGNFGTSPFTFEGKIADYPLNTPASYPLTMTITPRQPEVAWLLGQYRQGNLQFTGDAPLQLTGAGTSANFQLTGSWDLTPTAYSYPDFITKPSGRSNHLSFKGTVNQTEARVVSFQDELPPLSLAATASYLFAGNGCLKLAMVVDPFHLQEAAPLIPRFGKYQCRGKVAGAVHAESLANDPANLRWGGDIALTGASFKPAESVKTISNLNGSITFSGDTLETSLLTARLGDSTIYCRGSLTDLKNPTFSVAFSSPQLDLADFGLQRATGGVTLQKVSGNISLQKQTLQIKSLAAQLNDSILNLKGTVQDLRNPKIEITVTAPYLTYDDVVLLTELEPTKKGSAPARFALKALISADAGRVKDLPYKKLHTSLVYEEDILYCQSLDLALLGGTVSGRGRVDFGAKDGPRYQANYKTDRLAVASLLQLFGEKHGSITGNLSMDGELTGKGKTAVELKKSLLGTVNISFADGTLQKFAVLSKILSILNLSQLIKGQLPEMVAGGMPYNTITGQLSFRDGVVSTTDLFVDSDAINISVVGKADLLKEELDLTIGVQPLQTVDKVVSHIPIVGWILTGKGKSLVTAYFEARGKWQDPTVTAIPVKGMAKGVLEIFKRVFQLPAKLITDTGEVITGN